MVLRHGIAMAMAVERERSQSNIPIFCATRTLGRVHLTAGVVVCVTGVWFLVSQAEHISFFTSVAFVEQATAQSLACCRVACRHQVQRPAVKFS